MGARGDLTVKITLSKTRKRHGVATWISVCVWGGAFGRSPKAGVNLLKADRPRELRGEAWE